MRKNCYMLRIIRGIKQDKVKEIRNLLFSYLFFFAMIEAETQLKERITCQLF